MAINDFLKLHDEKLREVFSRKEYDPTKDRQAMVKRLDKAHSQFQSATPVKGRKMFKIANGVVELTLPFSIAGRSTFHLPTECFSDAITHLKEAIGKGEADEHFKAAAERSTPATRTAKTREPGTGGGKAWSDERRARFAASIAARKAAKSG